MGTFIGHVFPGTGLVVVGFLAQILVLRRALRVGTPAAQEEVEEEGETSPPFSPSLSPWVIRDRKLLFYTGVVFLAIIVAGILQEELGWSLLGLEPVYSRSASNPGAFAHISMFSAFGLAALSCLLEGRGTVPSGIHRWALLVALLVELDLFTAHLHHQKGAEREFHICLTHVVGTGVFMLFLSIAFPHRLAPYALAFACVALQGIWFLVIAFSLFQSAVPFLHVSDENHGRVRPWFGILLTLFCLFEALVANFAIRSFGSEDCQRQWVLFCGGGGDEVDDAREMKSFARVGKGGGYRRVGRERRRGGGGGLGTGIEMSNMVDDIPLDSGGDEEDYIGSLSSDSGGAMNGGGRMGYASSSANML